MDAVNDAVVWFNDYYSYVLIVLLVGAGLYYSWRTRLVQLQMIPEMLRAVVERPASGDDDSDTKPISAFRAFSISAASRVGTGNVAGVAVAISVGGPGAVFWMWVLAVIGGATAFVESTLGQLYKVRDGADYRGGPAYYLSLGIRNRRVGAAMALIFAVTIVFTYGVVFNAVQSNSITHAVNNAVNQDAPWLPAVVGVVLALLAGAVIFGGVHRISGVSQIIVPAMALGYVGLAAVIFFVNLDQVPTVIADIVRSAFGVREVAGAGIWAAMTQGMRRGLFSNEAGMGSTPNAAATASVSHPVKQGLVQTLGVYFDTMIVCSATAVIILLSQPVFGTGFEGVELTQNALQHQIGSIAAPLLAVILFFLAFSSIVGNYYYGETNIAFFTENLWVRQVFRLIVVGVVFFGAVAKVDLVWNLADLASSIMATVNIAGLLMIGGTAMLLLRHYLAQKRMGLDPVFHRDDLPDLRGVSCWDGSDPEARRPVSAGPERR